jgi:hypothetical protein
VGLVLVFWAATLVPAVDCGSGDINAGSRQEMVLLVVTALATFCAGMAAAARTSELGRRQGWRAPTMFVCLGLGIAAAAAALAGAGFAVVLFAVWIFGMIATGIALVALLAFWAMGWSVDEAGVLLPLYLFGAGLVVYPAILLLSVYGHSGAAC